MVVKIVVFMPLTVVWMGQFFGNVIGHQNVEFAVICVGCCFTVTFDPSIGLLMSASFV